MAMITPSRGWLRSVVVAALVGALLVVGRGLFGGAMEAAPEITLHYAPNHNFDSNGHYAPAKFGFNLADVGSAAQLDALEPGAKALVWVGQCNGVDDSFLRAVRPFIGNPKVFGFYLMDDPDPRGSPLNGHLRRPPCRAEQLKAESVWIHTNAPGAKTFIVLMKMSSSTSPNFEHTYNPANTDLDLFGIDPYPCRTELNGCDLEMIDRYVRAAEASGVPRDRMVPVYQTFGGGDWLDDGGGRYTLPTADQECRILARWRTLLASPVFDFAYSWGVQKGDTALETAFDLRELFSLRNRGDSDPCRLAASK